MNRKFFKGISLKLHSIIAPSLKYSQKIYEEVLEKNCAIGSAWLDLGCGHKLLPPPRSKEETLLTKRAAVIIGLDYDWHSLVNHRSIKNRVRGDISKLPFRSASFDLVTSNMVFEHLDCPETQFEELCRIIKPGGKLIIHTPNKFGYTTIAARILPEKLKGKLVYFLQRRNEEDIFPAYYRINSKEKITQIAQDYGFKIKKMMMICTTPQFSMVTPIVFFELLFIRLLMTKSMKSFRTNIIVIMEKA